jgi:hypothetical protein
MAICTGFFVCLVGICLRAFRLVGLVEGVVGVCCLWVVFCCIGFAGMFVVLSLGGGVGVFVWCVGLCGFVLWLFFLGVLVMLFLVVGLFVLCPVFCDFFGVRCKLSVCCRRDSAGWDVFSMFFVLLFFVLCFRMVCAARRWFVPWRDCFWLCVAGTVIRSPGNGGCFCGGGLFLSSGFVCRWLDTVPMCCAPS